MKLLQFLVIILIYKLTKELITEIAFLEIPKTALFIGFVGAECSAHWFDCGNGKCISEVWQCDGDNDCENFKDEENCEKSSAQIECLSSQFQCTSDKHCIKEKWHCDGEKDCDDGSDEVRCAPMCQPEEFLCYESKSCIPKKFICDGDPDCSDGSDEDNCDQSTSTPKPELSSPVTSKDSSCNSFYCYLTGQCLPWEKVCDGLPDCNDSSDEGNQCSRACFENGGCSQICQRMPNGPKCFCYEGYRLLPDNKTCDDIDECETEGTCSHFCNNTEGGFKCNCAEGYVLQDHNKCKAEGRATIVYLLANAIMEFDLHYRSKHVIINASNGDIYGMDYDASYETFFFTDKYDESIKLYSPISGKLKTIFRKNLTPTDIRYDWITGNLYLNNMYSSILACTKDVRYCKTLIKSSRNQINSIQIAPESGLMFWTVWANERLMQHSGLIERAEMDGSHRLVIVSDKTNAPSAVTVDRIHKKIYWTDFSLNTLESADFHGLQRRQVVKSGMYHPSAVSLFEDDVYWADWVTDSISRCNKFTGEDCANITEADVKAQILLIVHKAMQPEVYNRCNNRKCTHLCLLTRSGSVCACDDIDNSSGVVETGLITPRCVGKDCEAEARDSTSNHISGWIVAVVLPFTVVAVMILYIFMCIRNRKRLRNVGKSVSVKFHNPKSGQDDPLGMDTDHRNQYDELVIEQDVESNQDRGCSNYTNSEPEESDMKSGLYMDVILPIGLATSSES